MSWISSNRAQLVVIAAAFATTSGLVWVASQVSADGVPTTDELVYSGRLVEDGDDRVSGMRDIRLTLWSDDVSTEASARVCRVIPPANVQVADGRFRIPLDDDACVRGIAQHPDVWVEVLVEGMSLGRTKLAAVPYALEANRASGAAGPLRLELDSLVPPGTVIAFAGPVVPSGWLACDGSELSRAEHPRLFAAIGTAHGAGDGATTFLAPDYRGRFLRGTDDGVGRDPSAATREAAASGGSVGDAVGSVQGDATARPTAGFTTNSAGAHTHTVSLRRRGDDGGSGNWNYANSGGVAASITTTSNGDHTHTVTGGGDAETRPVNAYVRYLIRR